MCREAHKEAMMPLEWTVKRPLGKFHKYNSLMTLHTFGDETSKSSIPLSVMAGKEGRYK